MISFLLFKKYSGLRIVRLTAIILTVCSAFLIAPLLYFKSADKMFIFYESVSEKLSYSNMEDDQSYKERKLAIDMGLAQLNMSPVYGVGFALGSFYDGTTEKIRRGWYADRNIFNYFGETGIIGIFFFAIFFIAVFLEGIAAVNMTRGDPLLNDMAIGFLSSFNGLICTRFFGRQYYFLYFWLVVAMIVIIRYYASASRLNSKESVSL
jgi:hypothetical protein